MKRTFIVVISFFGICGLLLAVLFGVLFFPGCQIMLNFAECPEYPETIPYYISTNETSISFSGYISDIPITEENAESIVREYLVENDAFPDDMFLTGISKSYTYKSSEHGWERDHFEGYDIRYGRLINNLSVYPADEINIRINEVAYITFGFMAYRNYTEVGEIEIRSPEKAFEKLKAQEDIVNPPMQFRGIWVKEISLRYYYIHDDSMLMPVWYFKGDNKGYFVKAYDSLE